MEEITAAIAHLAVESRQLLLCTGTPMAATFSSRHLLMSGFDLLFTVAVEAGILYSGAIREHRKGGDAQINPNLLF